MTKRQEISRDDGTEGCGGIFCRGDSMRPLFRPGDRIVFSPCHLGYIRRGDVIVFDAPGETSRIVHRVIAVEPDRFRTRGDANPGEDPWRLGRENLIGHVTAFDRNGRLHPVAGGWRGRLRALVIRTIRNVDRQSSTVIHPIYRSLSRSRLLDRFLPDSLVPRVITIRRNTGKEMQLLMGQRVIGRCLAGEKEWKIRRPYRIFVDEQALP